MIRLPIKTLLMFYDNPPKENGKHTTAITSVIGEDLGAGLLVDYFNRRGFSAKVLNQTITVGTNKGNRLDRWVVVTEGVREVYYQVEIKNWGATALNGRRLPLDANDERIRKHKKERWSREWDGTGFIKDAVKKVLIPMKPPKNAKYIEPLICFWDAMHPKGDDDALFSIPLKNQHFKRVWVYSMSSHLRNLLKASETTVKINAPDVEARMDWLSKIVK